MKRIRTFWMIPVVMVSFLSVMFSCTSGEKETPPITRIWLSYNATQPRNIVINWYTPVPADGEVELVYGDSTHVYAGTEKEDTIHHLEVPLSWKDSRYRYRVRSGQMTSGWYSFRGITEKEPVRIAVIGDWGFAVDADMSVILNEKPALIVTAGDNVQGLFLYGKKGDKTCVESYLRLVDSFPQLFRTVPFMPAPGNHDKQLYPRGKKAPEGYNLYDTNAVAFTNFFALPGKEWMWALDVPFTKLRLLTLDLNHIRDYGTTWQSCHGFGPASEQYLWYKKEITCNPCRQIITIYNGENRSVRAMAGGIWYPLTQQSDVIVSGSGYFAEYALVEGTPYLNASLIAGDLWPDPVAKFSKSVASYVMIVADKEKAQVSLKRLEDRSVIYEVDLPRR